MDNYLKIITVTTLIVTLAIILAFVMNFWGTNLSTGINDWGSFGDYFGGILGAIFSLLAVILIYFTYQQQKNHIENTEGVFEDQAKLNRSDSLMNIFFKVIENKQRHLTSFSYRPKEGVGRNQHDHTKIKSIEALKRMMKDYRDEFYKLEKKNDKRKALGIVRSLFFDNQDDLLPFVKTIARAIDIIHEVRRFDEMLSRILGEILRDSLSSSEIFLIHQISDIPKELRSEEMTFFLTDWSKANEVGLFEYLDIEKVNKMSFNQL
ncbi:MAG: hypothetical protein WD016_03810 [Balneolaceae bacterium]